MTSLQTRCSWFVLLFALPATAMCGGGTETDNPVLAGGPFESPERFAPEEPAPPGCVPPDLEEQPNLPAALPHALLLGDSLLLGKNYGGLQVFAESGEVTATPVRGVIHELREPSAGTSLRPMDGRMRSASTARCSAGRRIRRSTWARWAPTRFSRKADR